MVEKRLLFTLFINKNKEGVELSDIAAIVFDFGGVLMDWNPHYLYRSFFGNDPQATERFLAEVGFYEWNRQLDYGRPFAEVLGEAAARHPAHREMILAYDTRWEESIAGPIQPTVEILRELRETGHRLFALSNWSAKKFPLVRSKYEFFQWFEAIVLSGEEKTAKPEPAIYLALLRRAGLPAEECLFVDDSARNIEAARKLGFGTILYESPAQLRMELCRYGLLSSTMTA